MVYSPACLPRGIPWCIAKHASLGGIPWCIYPVYASLYALCRWYTPPYASRTPVSLLVSTVTRLHGHPFDTFSQKGRPEEALQHPFHCWVKKEGKPAGKRASQAMVGGEKHAGKRASQAMVGVDTLVYTTLGTHHPCICRYTPSSRVHQTDTRPS